MGIFDKTVNFNNQSYNTIWDLSKTTKNLFTDSTFPVTSPNIIENVDISNIVWKRPSDISMKPKLFCNNTASIISGSISNIHLASCLTLIRRKDCLKKVIPEYELQDWNSKKSGNYAGVFRFRFWRYGEIVEVVIDDLLPTVDGKLISVNTDEGNEFWCALLEKAYAKLLGSYKAVCDCSAEELLVDFTGGVPEILYSDFLIDDTKGDKYKFLDREFQEQSLIFVKIKYDSTEDQLSGLKPGELYSMTSIKSIPVKNTTLSVKYYKDKIFMIRLCNANGQKHWTGPFSVLSEEWNRLDSKEKLRLGLSVACEGDFWLNYQDLVSLVDHILIIRLPILSALTGAIHQVMPGPNRRVAAWKMSSGDEFWYSAANSIEEAISGKGGGGQFVFQIEPSTSLQPVLVHILLKCAKQFDVPLSLVLFEVERNRQTVMFSTRWVSKLKEDHIDQTRSLGVSYELKTGNYVLKAYIREKPADQLNYHLRVFTPQPNNGKFLLSEPPSQDFIMCFCIPDDCALITRLRIACATDLNWQKKYNEVFVEVSCENHDFITEPVSRTKDEAYRWETCFLFYQFNASAPITFRLYNKSYVMDTFIGKAIYHFDSKMLNKDPILVKFPLLDKQGNEITNPPKLEVAFWHTESYVNL